MGVLPSEPKSKALLAGQQINPINQPAKLRIVQHQACEQVKDTAKGVWGEKVRLRKDEEEEKKFLDIDPEDNLFAGVKLEAILSPIKEVAKTY